MSTILARPWSHSQHRPSNSPFISCCSGLRLVRLRGMSLSPPYPSRDAPPPCKELHVEANKPHATQLLLDLEGPRDGVWLGLLKEEARHRAVLHVVRNSAARSTRYSSSWNIRNCPNCRAYSRPHRTRLTHRQTFSTERFPRRARRDEFAGASPIRKSQN
jgi:hypothetical protein